MTLRSLLDRYRGWCPHFEAVPIQSTPLTNLTIGGKMVFSTLLGTTGLIAIFAAILLIPQYLESNMPWSSFLISTYLLNLVAGITMVVLLFDFFIKGSLLRRHKLEAALILSLWGVQHIITILFSLYGYNNQMFTLTQTISMAASALPSSTLFFFASYRLFSNKSMLVKQTFLLLSIYFLYPIIDPYIGYILDPMWRQRVTIDIIFGLATQMITFAVAGFFFFRTFLTARSQVGFTFKLPLYIVVDLFIYGASQTILGIYATFFDTISNPYTVWGFSYAHFNTIALLQSVMILLASFYIYKFKIGEKLVVTY